MQLASLGLGEEEVCHCRVVGCGAGPVRQEVTVKRVGSGTIDVQLRSSCGSYADAAPASPHSPWRIQQRLRRRRGE